MKTKRMLLFIPPAFAAAALANSYRMVWADGFNTEATPDPANWTYEHGFVRNKELQWYRPDNAGCSNGLLAIEGRREWKPNPNHKPGSNDPKKCSCQVWHYASLRCCRKPQPHWRVPWIQDLRPDGVDAYSQGLKPQ